MTAIHQAGAIRALTSELKNLKDEPLEGFRVGLVNDDNLFDWEIAIFGAPGTLYEGGYFKARMHFPSDYPYSPPSLRFQNPSLFHPNVYESGDLCISILHPPIEDPQSGELPCERWNPTQNVRTILLSVISLLNEPNTSSPANVDASVMFRRWKDSKGTDNEYEEVVKRQVAQSRAEAEKDGVVVPMTIEEYVIKPAAANTKSSIDIDMYDDDDDYDIDFPDNDTHIITYMIVS
ncbi:Ubiquitin-conjugating enzyme E2 R2 [Orchesella cincta]|uniref:Ubiquitin-conjugating enzyme E2 R2 n=1 Tax=Orchesella cincta TaxID=48709 RepID=A0A1D2N5B7_ORCCI|nr:Ubiquitin-conjugating enzyme E2 R2 [Orchesella cincta]